MKLRAEVVIDVEAADYIGAAEHQRFVESIFAQVKQHYTHATLSIRQLRDSAQNPPRTSLPRLRYDSGALAAYEDD